VHQVRVLHWTDARAKMRPIRPYIIKTLGRKRFPAANYVAPQLDNKYAHMVIEANGGEVVFEEYYSIDQAEYSATIIKIRDGTVDCVLQNHFFGETTPYKKSGC
jgi:Periplasmic binding protein domain